MPTRKMAREPGRWGLLNCGGFRVTVPTEDKSRVSAPAIWAVWAVWAVWAGMNGH